MEGWIHTLTHRPENPTVWLLAIKRAKRWMDCGSLLLRCHHRADVLLTRSSSESDRLVVNCFGGSCCGLPLYQRHEFVRGIEDKVRMKGSTAGKAPFRPLENNQPTTNKHNNTLFGGVEVDAACSQHDDTIELDLSCREKRHTYSDNDGDSWIDFRSLDDRHALRTHTLR